MDTQQQPQQRTQTPYGLVLVLLVVAGYLGWKLHNQELRTTPELPATFESRVEAVRSEGSDWQAGYFYVVGKTTYPPAQPQQPQAQPAPAMQQAQYDGSDILREIQAQNAAWDRYARAQGW